MRRSTKYFIILGVINIEKQQNETVTIHTNKSGLAVVTMDVNGIANIVPIKYYLTFSQTFTHNTYSLTIERTSNGGDIIVSGNCKAFISALVFPG